MIQYNIIYSNIVWYAILPKTKHFSYLVLLSCHVMSCQTKCSLLRWRNQSDRASPGSGGPAGQTMGGNWSSLIGLHWFESNWTELNHIELSWFDLICNMLIRLDLIRYDTKIRYDLRLLIIDSNLQIDEIRMSILILNTVLLALVIAVKRGREGWKKIFSDSKKVIRCDDIWWHDIG